jgi:hypothetical protein
MNATTEMVILPRKPVELVRVPGQFDRMDQDLVVATPTCCCCCCCLVTTFSALAYSSAMLTAETRKQNDPVARRFWFGFAGFFAPFMTSIISSSVFWALRIGSAGLVVGAVVQIAIFTALMVFLVGKASRNTRDSKEVATECVVFTLIVAACFAGELFSIGFVIFGQLAVLFVPWLIGNSRGFRGVDKTIAMAHRAKGNSALHPIPASSTSSTTTSTPTVWTSIEALPSPTASPISSPSDPQSPSDPASPSNPFPAFPTYIPPANDAPPSTDL